MQKENKFVEKKIFNNLCCKKDIQVKEYENDTEAAQHKDKLERKHCAARV